MAIYREDNLDVVENRMRRIVRPAYKTKWGAMYEGDCEEVLKLYPVTRRIGKVQLVLTSPPFPLNRKKKYGNLTGEEYLNWLKDLAPLFRNYLSPDGSIVLELGNAWEAGNPVMSTLPLKALMAFLEAGGLNLCQEFICYNPARLPTPAQWVTVERIRVKDSFTRVWWMSPTKRPKANNRNVLTHYSKSMQELLRRGTYNSGSRPSGHHIGSRSFLSDNGGAIPPNLLVPASTDEGLIEVLPIANTRAGDSYQVYCRKRNVGPHPARMQPELAGFFVRFLTDKNDLVLDPFAGSNTTGYAAERLRRRWLGIELDAGYVETSEVRFRPEMINET
jgi:DNA modification methylase